MPKMADTMPHYSSFGLAKRPKKFEMILGTSIFLSSFTWNDPRGDIDLEKQNWIRL